MNWRQLLLQWLFLPVKVAQWISFLFTFNHVLAVWNSLKFIVKHMLAWNTWIYKTAYILANVDLRATTHFIKLQYMSYETWFLEFGNTYNLFSHHVVECNPASYVTFHVSIYFFRCHPTAESRQFDGLVWSCGGGHLASRMPPLLWGWWKGY